MELEANTWKRTPSQSQARAGLQEARGAGLPSWPCNKGQSTDFLTVSLHPGPEKSPGHMIGQATAHVLVSPASPSDIKHIVY